MYSANFDNMILIFKVNMYEQIGKYNNQIKSSSNKISILVKAKSLSYDN